MKTAVRFGTTRNRYPAALLRSNSIAAAADVVCQHWTPVIIREVTLGKRRFDDIKHELGIAPNVLTTRLRRLVAEGVLERVTYCEHPLRAEYHLTEKGRELWPILALLGRWGEQHAGQGQATID